MKYRRWVGEGGGGWRREERKSLSRHKLAGVTRRLSSSIDYHDCKVVMQYIFIITCFHQQFTCM